jgi:hypothetical protein
VSVAGEGGRVVGVVSRADMLGTFAKATLGGGSFRARGTTRCGAPEARPR